MEQNQNAAVIAVIEFENVYSTKLLRIGDEVVMNMDKEARGHGREGVADGTKGTVMGFFEYYTTKHLNMRGVPGIYRGNGAAVVLWETGEVDTHGSDIAMPKHIVEARRNDDVYNEAFDKQIKQYDLPPFDYMVGNKIAYTWKHDSRNGRYTPQREIGTITNIDFDDIIERRTGRLLPMAKWHTDRIIHVDLEGGGSTRVSVAEIEELIEKGNYWAWENDKSQLSFKDLQAELGFYTSLGKRYQVRSPRSGDYKWILDDAVEAVRRGDIDGLGNSGSFFGSTPFPVAYKLEEDMAELAARCRAETVKGFADYVVGERPNRKYEVRYTMPNTEYSITATKEFDNSVHILPMKDKEMVLEGYDYLIVPDFSLRDDPDAPVVLKPAVLDPVYPKFTNGAGVESEIILTNEVRTEMALLFFNRLSEQGWIVDDSKFIKQ